MPNSPFEILQLVLRIALAVAFIGMGVMHFRPGPKRVMAKIIPPALRFEGVARPANLVTFTGICEIAGGIGLLIPATQLAAGICLAVFLMVVFPANAYAARHRDRFGKVAVPLVPRLIGQVILVALCLIAVI
ncbi:DoxX family protein [Homoserinimonas sp. OAct 916]|uniref:DoxX family protein n=1 Tax=Homoserinimonas sp. OAct 916 TaxID=2211450 RepID=UPI000DBE8A69|nr:DoxX family protein [Homoserinimonas sp. OAct 916]